jgi:uncharacterized protein YcfL
MKKNLIIFIITLVFLGCSSRNAFDHFSITAKQEFSENNIQSSKIINDDVTNGTVSMIYLNRVSSETYKDAEYFYIYLFTKDQNLPLSFKLNGSDALMVKELNSTNEFACLSLSHADWQKYYLVKFQEQGDILKLVVQNGEFSSDAITFEKDE